MHKGNNWILGVTFEFWPLDFSGVQFYGYRIIFFVFSTTWSHLHHFYTNIPVYSPPPPCPPRGSNYQMSQYLYIQLLIWSLSGLLFVFRFFGRKVCVRDSTELITDESKSIDDEKSTSIDDEESKSIDNEESKSIDNEELKSINDEESKSIDDEESKSIDDETSSKEAETSREKKEDKNKKLKF